MTGVPFETSVAEETSSKTSWDAGVHDLVSTMLDRWHLTAGEAFEGGVAAAVLSVTTSDGAPAVLKVGFPHWEAVYEAVGLDAYGPGLAPAVLRQDAWTWSLLLEQVAPGTSLGAVALRSDDALTIAARLHSRLAAVEIPDGVWSLDEVVASYLTRARSLSPDAGVDAALDELERLSKEPSDRMLLHGDFNPGNILASENGWRVIDPKPIVGDPAFDLWPLLEQVGGATRHTVELVARETGYDPERIARWGYARAGLNVTWMLDIDESPRRELVAGAQEWLEIWRRLSGS